MYGNLFIYEEMNKIISDNILKINFKVNREYDNYLFCRLIVLNFELFEVYILDEFNGLEISLEYENYFENIIIVDKV